jgi:AcrR family transcriptional regulator
MPRAEATVIAGRRTDRAEQILEAATRLFSERGYHDVSVQDIGDEVGLDASSLYFHFPSKGALLAAVFKRFSDLEDEAPVEPLPESASPNEQFVIWLTKFIRDQVKRRLSYIVTPIDVELLPSDLATELLAKRRASLRTPATLLTTIHPDLTPRDAAFMADVMTGLVYNMSRTQPSLSKGRLAEVLVRLSSAAMFVAPDGRVPSFEVGLERSLHGSGRRVRGRGQYIRQRSSSRERILVGALPLFRIYGFNGVGVDEIAEKVGITGPGVYRHFESKDELLNAILVRASDSLASSVGRAFANANDARDALDRLIDNYLELSVDESELLAVYWREGEALPKKGRLLIARERRAFINDWIGVLTDVRPELSDDEARIAVFGALSVLNGYWFLSLSTVPAEQARPLLRSMARNLLLNA